ncbi:MAG TPA: hypothetical protein VJO35_13080 [Terriglobales bacterium]|nr:hypothetical protein [Terriglobales bacterium]
MWWIAFTVVDLYICLVIVKSIEPTLTPEKQKRAAIAVKSIVCAMGVGGALLIKRLLKCF